MISPTTNSNLFGTTATASTAPKKSLDKDAFLKLFITQLKNQDPSSPLQPHELAAQLAQFTSVEQLTKINDAMTAQASATQASTLINQASLSTSLFGRQVIAGGDMVHVPQTGSARIHVEVGGSGGMATLSIKDGTGREIGTRDLGQLSQGAQDITLPSNLPPGDWHYSLKVTGANKASVPVNTYTMGTVTGVNFGSGRLTLALGTLQVAFEDIVQIEPMSSSTTTNNPGGTTPSVPVGPGPGGGPGDPSVPDPYLPTLRH